MAGRAGRGAPAIACCSAMVLPGPVAARSTMSSSGFSGIRAAREFIELHGLESLRPRFRRVSPFAAEIRTSPQMPARRSRIGRPDGKRVNKHKYYPCPTTERKPCPGSEGRPDGKGHEFRRPDEERRVDDPNQGRGMRNIASALACWPPLVALPRVRLCSAANQQPNPNGRSSRRRCRPGRHRQCRRRRHRPLCMTLTTSPAEGVPPVLLAAITQSL